MSKSSSKLFNVSKSRTPPQTPPSSSAHHGVDADDDESDEDQIQREQQLYNESLAVDSIYEYKDADNNSSSDSDNSHVADFEVDEATAELEELEQDGDSEEPDGISLDGSSDGSLSSASYASATSLRSYSSSSSSNRHKRHKHIDDDDRHSSRSSSSSSSSSSRKRNRKDKNRTKHKRSRSRSVSPQSSPPHASPPPAPTSSGTAKKGVKRKQKASKQTTIPYEFPQRGAHIANAELDAPVALDSQGTQEVSEQKAPLIQMPYDPDSGEWDGVVEEEEPEAGYEQYCALCENDQNEEEREANPHVQLLKDHYDENILEVSRPRLGGQCQQLFNKKIRKFTPGRRFISKRMICEHFEVHSVNQRIIKSLELRNLNFALRIMLKGALYKIDQDGCKTVDAATMRLYKDIMKERNSIMNDVFTSRK